jgi:ERF superfamily.
MTATLLEKLSNIQIELKAPKNQFNKFGGYKYRNCEDILEAVKPICHKNRTSLTLDDELVLLGDRYYIRAVAKLYDWDSEITITTSALARETSAKKGMDESQITGSASSYARKYALNGLFNIDDTKDVDTNELSEETKNRKQQSSKNTKKDDTKDKSIIIYNYYKEHKDTFGKVLIGVLNGRKNVQELSENEKDQLIELINTSKHTMEVA